MKKYLHFALTTMMPLIIATTSAYAAAQAKAMPPIPQGGPTLQDKMVKASFPDITYGNISKNQTLDIYLPQDRKGPFPMVIYAHPGGFKFGDKKIASFRIVNAMLNKGYAFVSVNYRLSGESTFPAAVQDFFTAVEFVTLHANDYNLKSGSPYFYGESAGANIVSLAGLAYDNPDFNKEKITPTHYIKPQGVIALYPPVDFSKIAQFVNAQGCATDNDSEMLTLEEQYIGGKLSDNVEKVNAANPANYVKRNAPAFLIENGSNDCNVGADQSRILVNALEKYQDSVNYEMLEGAGHGGLAFESDANIKKLIDFLL
ncbi:alpha/beta hydrolase [Klebsiella michiganensis]|uniref:alpha/beta hydrolase n=1 Tax=Klebsiella michiganensis TaxID=1134687 RepID=UPI00259965D2|nr:alpha/beta hydrolase [Klebsiella michiganensis]MDM4472066.1 alpha/beta hydrolase [Klebsiella michiganensis]